MRPTKNLEGDTWSIFDIFGELNKRLYELESGINLQYLKKDKRDIIFDVINYYTNYNPNEVLNMVSLCYSKIENLQNKVTDDDINDELGYYKSHLDTIKNYFDQQHGLKIKEERYKWNKKDVDLVELGYSLLLSDAIKISGSKNKEEFIRHLAEVFNTKAPQKPYDIINEITQREHNTKFLDELKKAFNEFIISKLK